MAFEGWGAVVWYNIPQEELRASVQGLCNYKEIRPVGRGW